MLCAAESLPGPVLYADLGDEIAITVNNLCQEDIIDIHWHGLPMVTYSPSRSIPSSLTKPYQALSRLHSLSSLRLPQTSHAHWAEGSTEPLFKDTVQPLQDVYLLTYLTLNRQMEAWWLDAEGDSMGRWSFYDNRLWDSACDWLPHLQAPI